MLSEAHIIYGVYLMNNEGFETLHKQWMSLFAVHHPIYCTNRVRKSWYLVYNLRLDLSGNGMMRPIGGRQMLSVVPRIFLMYLRSDFKHFISNGCLSPL